MKKSFSVTILILIVFGISTICFGERVLYEAQKIDDNKIRVYLKWEKPNTSMGIFPKYYFVEKQNILTVGYEVKDRTNINPFVDIDIRSIASPIIIVPQEVGNNVNPIFSDIKENYAKDYIRNLYGLGVVSGMPDGAFSPYVKVTRGEFVTMLSKVLRVEVKEEAVSFVDLKGHWAKPYFKYFIDKGVIHGYPDGTIGPDKPISIAEACACIQKIFTFKKNREGYYQKLKKGKWYSEAVRRVFDAEILNTEDMIYRNFNEDDELNRADVSIMLSRAGSVN